MTTKKLAWNRVAYPGKFFHKSGSFEMNDETFRSIIDSFSRRKAAILVDFDHKSEQADCAGNGDKIASGWCRALELRGSDLFAGIEWTERAKRLIQAKEYCFLSPAVAFQSRDSVTGEILPARLSSIGLVNKPFLSQLDPVLASDATTSFLMSELSELDLAQLSASDGEDHLLTMADHTTLMADALRVEAASWSLQLHDTQVKLSDAETAAQVAEARATALEAKVKLMHDQANDALVEDRFNLYRQSRSLGVHAKRTMKLILASDPSLFHAEYPPLPNNAPSYMTRKLSEDNSGSAALAGIKTVAPLSEIIKSTIEANPGRDYDSNFTAALSQYNTALAQGMMH